MEALRGQTDANMLSRRTSLFPREPTWGRWPSPTLREQLLCLYLLMEYGIIEGRKVDTAIENYLRGDSSEWAMTGLGEAQKFDVQLASAVRFDIESLVHDAHMSPTQANFDNAAETITLAYGNEKLRVFDRTKERLQAFAKLGAE